MSHNLEQRNGVTSFAENILQEKAWHGLGQQFEGRMLVADALKACHADYTVSLQPVAALTPAIIEKMANGENIPSDELLSLIVKDAKATMRLDYNEVLGMVSDKYGIVQNEDAFKFVDMFCSGQFANRDNTPTIESCGVLGHGERVFVTAKFPQDIILNSKTDDRVEMYVVFTTSHDGTGAVRCMVTPVRVVCNNTLNLAFRENAGSISFRHSSNVMQRLDLTVKENAEFAYRALGLADTYAKVMQEKLEHLKNIKISEKELNSILASISLSDASQKIYAETGNIFHEDIPTRGRNIFLGMQQAVANGVGQDLVESGNALWALNGITTFYQNGTKFKNDEMKLNSLLEGNVSKKVQKAYELLESVA